MNARRYAQTPTKSPTLTGGDDRPAPACAGRWFIYDVITDLTSGPVFQSAVAEARTICATCPLMAACLSENSGERWARAILGPRVDYVGKRRRALESKRAQDRHAVLVDLVERGALVEEALAVLGLTDRHQLYKWCHRHKCLDLWRALAPQRKAECGTTSGRSRHVDAGEKPCRACSDAYNAYRRERHAKGAAA